MEKLIAWLIGIEEWAGRLYSACAQAVAVENPAAGKMLARLCEDEARHAVYLEQAGDCCVRLGNPAEAIRLDRATRTRAEAPLEELQKALDGGQLELAQIIEKVIQIERSEWNSLFLYVVNALQTHCREMAHAAPQIQHHLRYIENSLAAMVPDKGGVAEIRAIPTVWQEKILIVEDDAPIVALLKAFLSQEGVVHTAANGAAALQMTAQHYFAAIISDIDMPVMDGWAFYRHAVRQFGNIGQRMIFISGDPTSPSGRKIRKEGLQMLAKPFSLIEIQKKIYELMECNTRNDCAGHGRT